MSSFLRILLVGAGQIGSRHLQALASVDSVTEVVAVDLPILLYIEPNPYGLKLKAQVTRLFPLFLS